MRFCVFGTHRSEVPLPGPDLRGSVMSTCLVRGTVNLIKCLHCRVAAFLFVISVLGETLGFRLLIVASIGGFY